MIAGEVQLFRKPDFFRNVNLPERSPANKAQPDFSVEASRPMIRPQTCPICGKNVPPATDPSGGQAPFCSQRCREVDFFRWADGKYAIVEPLSPAELDDLPDEAFDPESLPENDSD